MGLLCSNLDSAVLDFEALVERCVGNTEFAERVLNKFVDRFNTDLEQLERELEQQNVAEVTQLAHRIKGASASVSAGELSRHAADIEQLCREDRLTEVPAGLSGLRDAWSRLAETVGKNELVDNASV